MRKRRKKVKIAKRIKKASLVQRLKKAASRSKKKKKVTRRPSNRLNNLRKKTKLKNKHSLLRFIPTSTTLTHSLDMISGMTENPKFSFIAPAIRDYYYEDFYHNIKSFNSVSFEIIFVGDKKPLRQMPDNFHYIETSVKPSQCYEIAARRAKGEFLVMTGDDLRYSKECFDNMIGSCEALDMDKTFIFFIHIKPGGKKEKIGGVKTSNGVWLTASSHVMKRSIWLDLGGCDRKMGYGGACHDIQQRLYAMGHKSFVAKNCFSTEIENSILMGGSSMKRLMLRYYDDKEPLQCWTYYDDGREPERIPSEPYDDEDILIKDQY